MGACRHFRPLHSSGTVGEGWWEAGTGRASSHFLGSFSPDSHLQLGPQHGKAWLAAPAGPRKWPLGPSHPDAHLPLPGVLATCGRHRVSHARGL